MKLLQLTDTHNDSIGIANANLVMDQMRNQVDAIVHTGDIRQDCFTSKMGDLDLSKIQFVVGNHCMLAEEGTKVSPWDATKQPTQEEAYNAYFRDYVSARGINITENTLYWYKDYYDFRLIGLDCTARGDVDTAEKEWLTNLLKDHSRPVVILSHILPSSCVLVDCNMTSPYFINRLYWPQDNKANEDSVFPFIKESFEIVNTAVGEGLKVICWLFGHEHADGVCYSNDKKDATTYPMVSLGSIVHDSFNNIVRSGKSGDYDRDVCMNLYTWDKEIDCLEITRVGQSGRAGGTFRKYGYFDFNRHEYISVLDRHDR